MTTTPHLKTNGLLSEAPPKTPHNPPEGEDKKKAETTQNETSFLSQRANLEALYDGKIGPALELEADFSFFKDKFGLKIDDPNMTNYRLFKQESTGNRFGIFGGIKYDVSDDIQLRGLLGYNTYSVDWQPATTSSEKSQQLLLSLDGFVAKAQVLFNRQGLAPYLGAHVGFYQPSVQPDSRVDVGLPHLYQVESQSPLNLDPSLSYGLEAGLFMGPFKIFCGIDHISVTGFHEEGLVKMIPSNDLNIWRCGFGVELMSIVDKSLPSSDSSDL